MPEDIRLKCLYDCHFVATIFNYPIFGQNCIGSALALKTTAVVVIRKIIVLLIGYYLEVDHKTEIILTVVKVQIYQHNMLFYEFLLESKF